MARLKIDRFTTTAPGLRPATADETQPILNRRMHLSSPFLRDLGSTGGYLSLDFVQHVWLIVSLNLPRRWELLFRPVVPYLQIVDSNVPPSDDQFDLVTAKPLAAYELLAMVGTVFGYSTCLSNLAKKPPVSLSG